MWRLGWRCPFEFKDAMVVSIPPEAVWGKSHNGFWCIWKSPIATRQLVDAPHILTSKVIGEYPPIRKPGSWNCMSLGCFFLQEQHEDSHLFLNNNPSSYFSEGLFYHQPVYPYASHGAGIFTKSCILYTSTMGCWDSYYMLLPVDRSLASSVTLVKFSDETKAPKIQISPLANI